MSEVLRLANVSRRYSEGGGQLEIFSGVDLSLQAGEIVALVGQSGAGKSSLLHMAGLLEAPSGGEIHVNGQAVSSLPEQERTRMMVGIDRDFAAEAIDPPVMNDRRVFPDPFLFLPVFGLLGLLCGLGYGLVRKR